MQLKGYGESFITLEKNFMVKVRRTEDDKSRRPLLLVGEHWLSVRAEQQLHFFFYHVDAHGYL